MVSLGECQVSASRLASRAHAPPSHLHSVVAQIDSLLSLFWHPSPAPTHFVSSWWIRETGDLKSTGALLHGHKMRRQPVPSALPLRLLLLFFQLLFPLPRATFGIVMARGKVAAGELLPRVESNGYKKGAYREKAAFRTIKATWTRPRRIKLQR